MRSPLVFLFSLIAISIVAASPISNSAVASAKAPAKQEQFEGSPAWQKADLRLREAWRDAISKGDKAMSLECIVKTKAPLSPDDKVVLTSAGFVVRSVIGNIATGSLAADNLPSVAALNFIEAMELAAPMSLKNMKAK